MKLNKSLKLSAALLLALPLTSSCYKEDAQELYSRQYINSVSLQQLNATADSLNARINDVQKVVEVLRQRKPVYKMTYNIVDGDTLGVSLTLDSLVAYVPFGRDGKDGVDGKDGKDGTQITVSADGFWVINGQKTDVRAQGRDGKDGADGKDGKDGTQITVSAEGFWVIDGQKTNLRAQGRDGKDGRNGADGKAPVISIGANGNWLIDGEDTGHSSLGQKGEKGDQGEKGADGQRGESPLLSLRENPDDPADANVYWYITYPDGTGDFLLFDGERVRATGEKGEKGDRGVQGPQGTPGVSSPITNIAYGPNNKSIVINTTLPGLAVVTIPLHNLHFDIQPEQVTSGGAPSAASFDMANMQLTFRPGETLTFPFTKDADLTRVNASLSNNWIVKVDMLQQTISITAPTVQQLASRDNFGVATFYARNEEGNTYSRDLIVIVPKQLEIGYYYASNPQHQTDLPSTTTNEFDVSAEAGGFKHYFLMAARESNGSYSQIEEQHQDYTPAALTNMIKKDDFLSFDKTEALDNQRMRLVDFFYKPDSIRFERTGTNPNSASEFHLLPSKEYPNEMSDKFSYIADIPWSTFGAYRTFDTGNRYFNTTTRLKRLPMLIRVQIKDPKKNLHLPDGEAFDPSRVVLYHYSSYGFQANGTRIARKKQALDSKGKMVDKAYVTRVENAARYDNTKDVLTARFAASPVWNTGLVRLFIEYKKQDGTSINLIFSASNVGSFPSITNGVEILYSYQISMEGDEAGTSGGYIRVFSTDGSSRYIGYPYLNVTAGIENSY